MRWGKHSSRAYNMMFAGKKEWWRSSYMMEIWNYTVIIACNGVILRSRVALNESEQGIVIVNTKWSNIPGLHLSGIEYHSKEGSSEQDIFYSTENHLISARQGVIMSLLWLRFPACSCVYLASLTECDSHFSISCLLDDETKHCAWPLPLVSTLWPLVYAWPWGLDTARRIPGHCLLDYET